MTCELYYTFLSAVLQCLYFIDVMYATYAKIDCATYSSKTEYIGSTQLDSQRSHPG